MKEKYKGDAMVYIKNKVIEKIKPLNKSLELLYNANETIHEIAKENYVRTPISFIKYSFKFFIFSIQYLFTSLVEGVFGAINFVIGLFTGGKDNTDNTVFVEDV